MSAQTITGAIGRSTKFLEVDEFLPSPFDAVPVASFFAPNLSFVNGNSATSNGINQWWVPSGGPVTLAASASATYTLTALTDAINRSVSFAGGVRAWGILVTSRTAGDYLTVGQAASNPWTSWLVGTTPGIKVYKWFSLGADLTDKYAVTASSNEQIKVTNSGSNSITFQFLMAGCLT